MSYDSKVGPERPRRTCAEPLPDTLEAAHARIRYLERTLDTSTEHRKLLLKLRQEADKLLWLYAEGKGPRMLMRSLNGLREAVDASDSTLVRWPEYRVEGPTGE